MDLARELHKSRQEILALPGLEFLYWKEYFQTRPFTHQLLERNFARLTAFVFNTSLRAKQRIEMDHLLPDYLKESKAVVFVPKTLEQQRQEFLNFKMKLETLKAQTKRKPL
jgi:hypothetical protein